MNTTPPAATLARAAAREPEFLTVREIAARLRLAKMTVYRLIETGAFPGTIRVGRSYRVPVAAYEAYLTSRVITP